MKLKTLYTFSVIGIFLVAFGAGWITLTHIASLPLDHLTAIGAGFTMAGMAIIISTLSTIRKIDVIVDELG